MAKDADELLELAAETGGCGTAIGPGGAKNCDPVLAKADELLELAAETRCCGVAEGLDARLNSG